MNLHSILLERAYDSRLSAPHFAGEQVLAAGVGATAQTVSDIFNWYNTKKTNENNLDIANANNETAIQLARENNALQQSMLNQNLDWSSAEAEKAYQRELEKIRQEREYNTPLQQVKRLREAGLNPALAFGGQNTTQIAGTSAPQASPMGSGISPSMPVLSTPHMEAFHMTSPTAAFSEMAEGLAALASAKKEGVETDRLEKTLDSYVKEMESNAEMASIKTLNEAYFSFKERSLGIRQIETDIYKNELLAANAKLEGDEIRSRTILNRAEASYKHQLKSLSQDEQKFLGMKMKGFWPELNATIAHIQAQTADAFASAGAH